MSPFEKLLHTQATQDGGRPPSPSFARNTFVHGNKEKCEGDAVMSHSASAGGQEWKEIVFLFLKKPQTFQGVGRIAGQQVFRERGPQRGKKTRNEARFLTFDFLKSMLVYSKLSKTGNRATTVLFFAKKNLFNKLAFSLSFPI